MPDISEKNFEATIERLCEYRTALTLSPSVASRISSAVTGKIQVT
jgi:hypothetical protein